MSTRPDTPSTQASLQSALDELEPATIAVVGATGSGKSTFINLVSGSNLAVGKTLDSCTAEIAVADPFVLLARTVTLIDTPGFDDTTMSETKILRLLTDFLRERYERGHLLAGIIFLHRISDFRVGGVALRNITHFKKLCGEGAYQNVRIVTNMWGDVAKEDGEVRHKELGSDPELFGDLVQKGATLLRHDGSVESAEQIVGSLLGADAEYEPLEVQVEMVDQNKTFSETKLGVSLSEELDKQYHKYQGDFKELKNEIKQLMEQRDGKHQEDLDELKADLKRVKGQLEKVEGEKQVLVDRDSEEIREQEERVKKLADAMDRRDLELQKLYQRLDEQARALTALATEKDQALRKAESERMAAEAAHNAELEEIKKKLEEDKREANDRFNLVAEGQRGQLDALRAVLEKDGKQVGNELEVLRAAVGKGKEEGEDRIQALAVAMEGAEKKAEAKMKEAEQAHRLRLETALKEAEERLGAATGQYQTQLEELKALQEAREHQIDDVVKNLLQERKAELEGMQRNSSRDPEDEWEDVAEAPKKPKRVVNHPAIRPKVAGGANRRPRHKDRAQERGIPVGFFRQMGVALEMMLGEGAH